MAYRHSGTDLSHHIPASRLLLIVFSWRLLQRIHNPVREEFGHADTFMHDESHKSASHLHLSAEEFRGETIYFSVTDRFNVGKKHVFKSVEMDDPTHRDWIKLGGRSSGSHR